MSKTFDNSQIINQVQSFKGFKNRIINGGFQVKQRGVNILNNTQDFILDRFQSQTAGSIITAKDLIVAPDSVPLVDNVDPFGDGSGVALWKLDGNANDAGGNYNGTWSGTEQYDAGIFGQGAKFDGGNFSYQIKADGITEISGNNPRTLSLWVKWNSIVDCTGIITQDGSPTDTIHGDNTTFMLAYRNNSYELLAHNNDTPFDVREYNTSSFIHLVVVYNQSTLKLYRNNTLVSEKSNTDFNTATTQFLIGTGWSKGDFHNFDGLIDQVRIFNRVLTDDEIQKLYLEESKVIKKPYSITLKTGNKPTDYTTQTIKNLVYRFEGQHLYDLITEGKKATLSFKMTAKKAGKYSIALINKTTSNYETLLQTFDYNGNQDEKVSVTFDLSQFQNEVRNDENLGCELVICGYTEDNNLVGSIGRNDGEKICASGCVAIDDNDSISVTGLQLEEGDVATDFEVIPYDVELQRCMRYYEKITVEATGTRIITGKAEADKVGGFTLPITKKRIIPSLSFNHLYLTKGNGAGEIVTDCVLITRYGTIACYAENLTANDAYALRFGNTSAYIELDAEL